MSDLPVPDSAEFQVGPTGPSIGFMARMILEGPFSAILMDRNLRVFEVARAWTQETNIPRETLLGRPIHQLIHDDASQAELFTRSLNGERTFGQPVRIDRPVGGHFWLRLESAPWYDEAGAVAGVMSFGRNVTTIVESRQALERSEHRLKMALDMDQTLVWEKNLKTGEVYMSGTLGQPLPGLESGKSVLELVHPDDQKMVRREWRRHVSRGAAYETEVRLPGVDGKEKWLHSVQTLVRDSDGRAESILGVVKDVTKRRTAEAEIERLAFRDTLTGLSNRAFFQRRFSDAVENAQRRHGTMGLIMLDVDHFKDVNDSFGHDAGDFLLQSIAALFDRAFRKTDLVARLGGDEFAIAMPDATDATALIRPVNTFLDLLKEPIEHRGKHFNIGVSIGAALLSPDEDAAQLLKNADIALYEAKYAGRGRVVLFQPAMRTVVETRTNLLREVREGILRNEFVLYYQPVVDIVDINNQCVTGFEALMRWVHPTKGVLTPAHFMAAFEDQDLSLRLGEVTLNAAFQQMRLWLDQGVTFGRVAVNVSSAQFRSGKLATTVQAKLQLWNIPPECLTIEVTENVYMGWSWDAVSETIRTLHNTGVQIALDDFGTGYASLANLRQFPIDRLKIDKSFIQNPDDNAIVRAVIGLGSSMGMKVIAEGVENIEQLDLLRQQGCDQVQGFHFSQAMPAGEVPEYLRLFGTGK